MGCSGAVRGRPRRGMPLPLRLRCLSALLLLLALPAAAATTAREEAEIMLRLRALLHSAVPQWVAYRPGWNPVNNATHCRWSFVLCDDAQRVTSLVLVGRLPRPNGGPPVLPAGEPEPLPAGGGGGGVSALALPPDLARLDQLQELALAQPFVPLTGGLPGAWLSPEAFPRLRRLQLWATELGAPLPDFPPGALPALRSLDLRLAAAATLPAGWASPGVLPALQSLTLAAGWHGALPRLWSRGFPRLAALHLWDYHWASASAAAAGSHSSMPGRNGSSAAGGGSGSQPLPGALLPPEAAMGPDWPQGRPPRRAGPPPTLPEDWGSGFPLLGRLSLRGMGLSGTLPPTWLGKGALARLALLDLSDNALSGSLPPTLFDTLTRLRSLTLDGNDFTGALPDAWASAQVEALALARNRLSGPAFPPAWLAPGSLPALHTLSLTGNPGLGGSLPPALPWPRIQSLLLAGTALHGRIPQGWCETFRLSLRTLWIGGTAIDPALPACPTRDVSHTFVQLDVPPSGSTGGGTSSGASSSGDGEILPAGGSRRRPEAPGLSGGGVTISPAIVAATAVAATAAMLASGVAGALLWRHMHRSQLAEQARRGGGDGDRQRLLGGDGGGRGGPDAELGLALVRQPSLGGLAASAGGAGGSASRLLSHQQQQQQQGPQLEQQQQQQLGQEILPVSDSAAEPGYADGDAAIASMRSQGRSRCDRTGALLARTLSGAGGKVGEIELHPMGDLPAEIEHRVEAATAGLSGAATPAQLPSGSLASCSAALAELAARHASLAAAVGGAAAADRAQDGPRAPPGFQRYAADASGSTAGWSTGSPAGSGLLGGGGPCSGSTVLPPSPGSSGALGTLGPPGAADPYASKPRGQQRSWGLDPMAVQLAPKALEFEKDAEGQLVVLGEGGFAVVYRGRLGGRPVAVKVFELLPDIDSTAVWREVALLRQCTHPRIVPVHGVAAKGPVLMLAMELMEGGSLREALLQPHTRQRLRWHAGGRQVAADVAEALDYLHTRHQIMHSDLKASNVLLSGEGRASLADLGVSQVLLSSARSAEGLSLLYAAPEQVMGVKCTLAADIYSLGILLVELTTQQVGTKRGEWRLPRSPQECSQEVLDLIQACINPSPQRRPTAAQVLQALQADAARAAASMQPEGPAAAAATVQLPRQAGSAPGSFGF